MNIGNTIKEFRKKRNFSQSELSKFTGISITTISQIELNNRQPHKNTIQKISKALNVPISVLNFYSINIEDVADNKKELYKVLEPSLKKIIQSLFDIE